MNSIVSPIYRLQLTVLVFYLALRGLDTIEDDMDAFTDQEAKVCCVLPA